MKLNLGCGEDYREGWTNVDVSSNVKCDSTHDLNQFPYPFESNSCDEIMCKEVLEHVDDVVKVMEELYRLMKHGGKLHIAVPHYSCSNAYTDPTHKRYLGYFSFDYFTGENQWAFYTGIRFKYVDRKLLFFGRIKNRIRQWFANRYPRFYEEHLAWILPAWYLSVTLEAIKD